MVFSLVGKKQSLTTGHVAWNANCTWTSLCLWSNYNTNARWLHGYASWRIENKKGCWVIHGPPITCIMSCSSILEIILCYSSSSTICIVAATPFIRGKYFSQKWKAFPKNASRKFKWRNPFCMKLQLSNLQLLLFKLF